MASSMDNANNPLERVETRKAHAWWWESHVNSKNAKWLTTSLEEMEQSTSQMVHLIQNDGDTLARKAEMYYERLPQLIEQIREFQRMYRTLAERYKNLIGDLHTHLSEMNLPATVSPDSGSEPGTPRFNNDVKPNPFKSIHRALGFDVFLRSNAVRSPREVSPMPGFEDADLHNFPRSPQLPEKLIPMGAELDITKETTGMANPDLAELQLKIASYEVEIGKLKMELENVRSLNDKPKIAKQEVDEAQIQVEVESDHAVDTQKAAVEKNSSKEIKQLVMELTEKSDQLEELKLQVERKNKLILEAGEEKLEAIRQLSFALEHYRRGYEQLREAAFIEEQRRLAS